MLFSGRGAVLGLVACATAIALVASQAGGAPTASRAGAANALIGAVTNVTPPDDLVHPSVELEGQITAATHKIAYRNCKVDRTIHVDAVRVSGAVRPEGDTYPSSRSGHFDFGPTTLEYGGTDSQGRFYDGHVPWSGGSATFILSTGKIKVARDKLGFRSYTCRPLRLTLQVSIPPYPTYPEIP
jgi:hypothetical protein